MFRFISLFYFLLLCRALELISLVVEGAVMDTANLPDLEQKLKDLKITLVINAAGPFQGQDYSVAETCIKAG